MMNHPQEHELDVHNVKILFSPRNLDTLAEVVAILAFDHNRVHLRAICLAAFSVVMLAHSGIMSNDILQPTHPVAESF
ncbi:hypothetical protein JTE90_017709 [Oedothorax gibbosus]|uniref:Uncharacterized protein n=1 Tax=Oedothorax gibbosus TaxID=931172 RepID=A0AAV6U7J4_9ARAC|nr:hypothetical protein JTE90_017709 [Oedothorax gibbosus]